MTSEESLASRALLSALGPPMERDDSRLARSVSGKIVLITGASYGQGEATAKLLAGSGATVVLAARSEERLAEVASEIVTAGGLAHAYQVDLGDMCAVDSFSERVLADHGRVDVLVHNAGKSLRRTVYRSAARRSDMDAMVGVNFLGPMRLTLALLPSMKANGGAHIVNIATAGLWMASAAPRWSFYLSTKTGFDTWLRSVALEVGADGIDVTSIYAGHIKSRMVATEWVARSPGHTPAQAARVIGYALTHRPRTLAPRGMRLMRLLSVAFEAPLGKTMAFLDQRGSETPASEAAYLRAVAKEHEASPQLTVTSDHR
nr:SDR family NAD(P)-dependent oxidoreductase [Rhodococcus sp. (in: high G+C Gram-positive bacteria)]